MSTRVSDQDNVFLYDSVTGLPINTESFEDADTAYVFLNWVETRSGQDIRTFTDNHLQTYRGQFYNWWNDLSEDEQSAEIDKILNPA